jgi:AcrR family transcriptional regulator
MAGEKDEVRNASRALRDAAAALSRALGQTLAEAGVQAGREIAEELKQATQELNDAASRLDDSRRSPKAERTRADLLAAAGRVFAEKGYEGASVGDVAAAAGYTKGAVYANFGSKEELFLELAKELTALDAVFARPQPGEDVRAVFTAHPAADRSSEVMLGLEMYLYAIRHIEARADLAPLVERAYAGLAALVHRAQSGDDGQEPTQTERDTMLGLVAVHTVGAILAPLLPDPDEAPGAVNRLVERLLAD